MRSSYYKQQARSKEKETRVHGIDVVNVRDTPNGEIIGALYDGDRVTVKEAVDDTWTKIEYRGRDAYVVSRFLKEGIL